MTRTKIVNSVEVPLTPEEEAEWDAIEAAGLLKQAELARTKYQRDRAAEYPSIGDQLDALWKGGDAATAMLAQVQAVKAKYPKPTE
jgi:hypothetical protein